MKIKLITCALLAGMVAYMVKLAHSEGPSFAHIRELTVLISSEDFGGTGRGTGVLLDPMHVLTCAHVVMHDGNGDPELMVYTYPLGQVYRAKVDAIDAYDDLAILVLESSAPMKAPPVFQETVTEGDSVMAIGNALGGMKWLVTHGVVSNITKRYMLTDAAINPGNSGGPWVNDDGEIIALTDWRIGPDKGYPGFAGGVPAKTINNVIKSYHRRNEMSEILKALLANS